MAKFQIDDEIYVKSLDKIGYILEIDETDNSYGIWIPVDDKTYGNLEFFSENDLEKID